METMLAQAVIYLAAAVIAVPLSARLGLGSVLGYLAAGILIGPVFGLVGGAESEGLRHIAEFGVVMMLFLIGLELEPKALWDMRHKLLGLGGLQVSLTAAAIAAAMIWGAGLPWQQGLAIGFILSLSSTAIVLQTLDEKKLMQTAGGRNVFSVLLTQDIAVIPLLALLPLLAFGGGGAIGISPDGSIGHGGGEELHTTAHFLENMPGWGVTLVTIGIIAAILLAGIYGARPVFRYIHQARLPEMYTALALLIVVGTAVLCQAVGLSPALGTFMAGVVLASSEFRHELESDIEPFKGLLLGLFFITVGAGISFQAFLAEPLLLLGLTFGLIALKGAVLYVLALVFRLESRDRWLFTLSLAQAGEFGFVLTSFSLAQDVIAPVHEQRLLMVIALSMLMTPLLFILYERLADGIRGEVTREPDEVEDEGPVIIAGIGRFGQVVNRLVRSAGFETVVLDNNLAAIETMRTFGMRTWFGDPTQPSVLNAAGLMQARVLVVALDDRASSLRLVRHARRQRPDLHIVVRAYDRVHAYQLYHAGANDIVRELFDSSLRAGRYVLEEMGLSDWEASEAEMTFYHHDRANLKELAELWKPGVPVGKNPDYVSRSRELDTEMETALMSGIAANKQADPPTVGYRSKGGEPRERRG
ncbi:monovalent cation:proton antiporter-2 (CPA2) family protein [Pseudoroseicyclus tamaricis]|uniref:Potassium transporter n=1 Tax=Pseudoroseicyclus tamaricis TaxID=2705421 RepID=A0A6B2JKF7_9RHOB|nr:monovalent cation:proton antiporter-2 (CPA2) family protein [Pseudoroseicyclus tamaricis]NDV01971.1 potassium transporter [Pseudoroseicyclus tamaricis]